MNSQTSIAQLQQLSNQSQSCFIYIQTYTTLIILKQLTVAYLQIFSTVLQTVRVSLESKTTLHITSRNSSKL